MTGNRLRCGVVLGAWFLTLVTLILTGRTTVFLRPEFLWLLVCGAVIALGFLVAMLRNPAPMPVSRMFILLVPLLHIAASDPGSIGGDVFDKRFVGANTVPGVTTEAPAQPQSGSTVPDREISQAFMGQDETPMTAEPELTLLQLLRNPERHVGTRVEVMGLVHKDPKLADYFGPGRTVALYRFVVTCCAADAMPVTVALDAAGAADMDKEQWVRVEGIFDLDRFKDRAVPVVSNATLTPVERPVDPFLY